MTLRSAMLAAAAVAELVACAPAPQTAQHTVAEYRANAHLRREEFARCANDPGGLGKTPDCVNSREAQRIEDIGSARDAPSLDLQKPAKK